MKKFIIAGLLILGFSSASFALPELNTADDKFEDRASGAAFAYYQNSGSLLFTHTGNEEGAVFFAAMQTFLNNLPGYTNVVLSLADVAYTPYDGSSGTWESVPISNTIGFYSVKAGDYYALYLVDPAESTGSWSTFDIWNIGGPGTGGHPSNGGGGLEISHFIGYNPSSVPVPEPGTIILIGAGLVGLGLYGRKRMKI